MNKPSWPSLALAAFFLALAGLEIAHGIFRIDTLREGQKRELFERMERRHAELADDLRRRLATERAHARYLARMPSVRALLIATAAGAETRTPRSRAEADVLAYVASFGDIDRVEVLDASGVDVLRCERIGGGVGAIPSELLAREPNKFANELAQRASTGEVAMSRIDFDEQRVEVDASQRQVLHFALGIAGERDQHYGALALTVYAAPMLGAVRNFDPASGVQAIWMDENARDVAPLLGENGDMPRVDLSHRSADALAQLMRGEASVQDGDVRMFGAELNSEPRMFLVTSVPNAALERALGSLRGEYAWIIASMVAITCVLGLAAVFFQRLATRAFRLRETEASLREITQRREMEQRLATAERLSSIGLLTAGVAHEINNPLEGIGNYLRLLEKPGLPEEKRARYLELVRHGFERIGSIVRELLAFARTDVERGEVDLRRVVERAVSMVQYSESMRGVEVEKRGLDEPLIVSGDEGRLEQVVVNLLLNAATAMQGRGKVAILGERVDAVRGAEGAIVLAVEDGGPGIAPDDLPRIFDPFFTRTRGTGLGLAVSYGIVRAHGGLLTASNRAGSGARFVVRLPMAPTPPSVRA